MNKPHITMDGKLFITNNGLYYKNVKSDFEKIEMDRLPVVNVNDIREWILINYDPAISDLIDSIVTEKSIENNWSEEQVDDLLETINYKLKDALLTLVGTFAEEGKE